MGFASGSVTFRRFAVIGKAPAMVDQEMLDKLAAFRLQETEHGLPDETEYGWCGGRHILDGQFSFEHNVFADSLLMALRIDTNKVPSEVKKAYQIMEEDAATSASHGQPLGKSAKRDVKDAVRRRMEDDLRNGKFRRSKLVPVLWDLPAGALYTPAPPMVNDKLMELFERTFGLELEAQSAGSIASRVLSGAGRTRDYEDLRPTRFVHSPASEGEYPEYPWTAKGPQPKDFLGNEFLLWLWHEADSRGGAVDTDSGSVSVMIDKLLDLDCAYGQSGRDLLRGTGPAEMPEAHDALRCGKVPRRMGLVIESSGSQFQFGFSAESFTVSSARLPEVEEAENPRVLFEERIGLLRELCRSIDAIYEAFLKVRTSSKWESASTAIRRWINAAGKRVAAVA